MIFCRKCGAQMDNAARFCVMCGNPLDDVNDKNDAQTPDQYKSSESRVTEIKASADNIINNEMQGSVMDNYNAVTTENTSNKKFDFNNKKKDILSIILYVVGGLIIASCFIGGIVISSTINDMAASYNNYYNYYGMGAQQYATKSSSGTLYMFIIWLCGALSGITFIALGRIHAIVLKLSQKKEDNKEN